MPYIAPRNILSPDSLVVEFTLTPKPGFFTLPHSDDVPNGWGKPYEDANGNPVPPPGTPNGDGPVKFIGWSYKDSAWTIDREPGTQVYGNIDWAGPLPQGSTDDMRRPRISYWGPPSRYFSSPDFVYGSDQKHKEIYQDGKYLAIAPLPVLGAAIMEDNGESYLVVVCKKGVGDSVYIRPLPTPVVPSLLTEGTRASMESLYDEETNPDGWRFLLYIPPQNDGTVEALQATTPWFFNESGDVAQCVRDALVTFDNGVETGVKELGMARCKMTMTSPTKAVYAYIANTSGFTYSCHTVKGSEPHVTVHTANTGGASTTCTNENITPMYFAYQSRTADGQGNSPDHYMAVDHLTQEVRMDGSYAVAVDYYGDDEIVIYVTYDCWRQWSKWWRTCIDLDIDPNYDTGSYIDNNAQGDYWDYWSWWDASGNLIQTLLNAYDNAGGAAAYYANGGEDPPADPSDGRNAFWTGKTSHIVLDWVHPVSGKNTIYLHRLEQSSKTETGRVTENNRYIQYLDVRPKEGYLAVVYGNEEQQELISDFVYGGNSSPYEVEFIPFTQNLADANNLSPTRDITKPYTYNEIREDSYTVTKYANEVTYTRCEMVADSPTGATPSPHQPSSGEFSRDNFDWTYSVTTYTGAHPDEVKFDNQGYSPTPQYLHSSLPAGINEWPEWRTMVSTDPKCSMTGNAATLGPKSIISVEYTNPHEQKAYYNYITDGDLDSMVISATRYYPVGV